MTEALQQAMGYEIFDRGYTAKVYRLPGLPRTVCKSFNEDCRETLFPVEKRVYERFMANNYPVSILKYYGIHEELPSGLVLELAGKKNFYNWRWDMKASDNPVPEPEMLYRWAEQAAEALAFAHSLGVFNSDIHAINFFLDDNLNLKVGDWAGASIDGSRSLSSYRLRHRLFDADGTDVPRATGITATTEIFALGTVFWFMVTGHDPWPHLREPEDSEEIKKNIREKKFPDTSELLALGDIIAKCWSVEYFSMMEVGEAIKAERLLKLPRRFVKLCGVVPDKMI